MDIGIVITLLVFLLSIAGPVIEKQLKKAGKVEQAKTVRKITEALSGDDREEKTVPSSTEANDVREIRTESAVPPKTPASSPVLRPEMNAGHSPEADARAEVLALALEKYRARQKAKELELAEKTGPKSSSVKHAQPKEHLPSERKLDIDPRKLVLYSEIMKPKF